MDGGDSWQVVRAPSSWGKLKTLPLPEEEMLRGPIADGPNHVLAEGYDLLRTRMQTAAAPRGWTRMGITQAHAGAAGPQTALNLAFSEARRADCRVILIDLDIARQPILGMLGHDARANDPEGLDGWKLRENLALLTVPAPVEHAATTLMREGFRTRLSQQVELLLPDITLLHLPPLLDGDAGLAAMDMAQSVVLAVDGRSDVAPEIRKCETRINDICPLLGLFLHNGEA